MIGNDHYNLETAEKFALVALQLRNQGALEEQIKLNLFSYLPQIFSSEPSWIRHHVQGAETKLQVATEDRITNRFADSLVGNTTIEYESDLRRSGKHSTGLKQVKEHCAGLINEGTPPDRVIGILSDTVIWQAFKPFIRTGTTSGKLGSADIDLEQVSSVEISNERFEDSVSEFVIFCCKYLGRMESREISSLNIDSDLGLNSPFGQQYARQTCTIITETIDKNPTYSELITSLWKRFVAIAANNQQFSRQEYAEEFYLVTLAKLVAANVINRKATISDETEISSILDGQFFELRGLENFVEYDYFGWLNQAPISQNFFPIAQSIQRDLQAYDFDSLPQDDIFGKLMAVLGGKSDRALLGQEFTPQWLAGLLANQVLDMLPANEQPRLVDMCCGSGAMLVAVTKLQRHKLVSEGYKPGSRDAMLALTDCITGFDIDPLAVLFAKVNWIVANRDWLENAGRVSIPVYHADSLFVEIPFARDKGEANTHILRLYGDVELVLPTFLIGPSHRAIFDSLIKRSYNLANMNSGQPAAATIDKLIDSSGIKEADFTPEKRKQVWDFAYNLVEALTKLQARGLNGVWSFVLRNCYRPSLVAGQFNGLISNPPWLTLSKFADNPYKAALKELAGCLALSPKGSAHLHTELATIFLYAAIDRYLTKGSIIASILPGTVLNGVQHEPFRCGAPQDATKPIHFKLEELWKVASGTFKNEAVAVIGKNSPSPSIDGEIPGKAVSADKATPIKFSVARMGSRSAWSDEPAIITPAAEYFDTGRFQQGADLFPRTTIFHELDPIDETAHSVSAIDRFSSSNRFLVNQAKELPEFSIATGTIADEYVFDIQLSNHLAPFFLSPASRGILPLIKHASGWRTQTDQMIAADLDSSLVFKKIQIAQQFESAAQIFSRLDTDRAKLSTQNFAAGGYLVVYGAGGSEVCGAYRAITERDQDKLIIDQTLYWALAKTEAEALFLTGLLNSPALGPLIAPFQPKGQKGKRHIHTLPQKVIPTYDETSLLHISAVEATRKLIHEFNQLAGDDQKIREQLDPVKSLIHRRKNIRARLRELDTFEAWTHATAAALSPT